MPYRCRFCGGTYCDEHRLPENHDCPGLEEWNDPAGVFGRAGPEEEETSGLGRAVESVSAPGGALSYLRGNVTYVFIALMWLTVAIEFLVAPAFGVGGLTWQNLFTLNPQNVTWVFPWFVAIFAHGGFAHVFFNSIVLYFFGPVVERRIGSTKFTVLFLAAGALAGLAQVGTGILLGSYVPVLGASGAIMAIMGVLTVLNPHVRVYLYFLIPLPLWVLTLGYALISIAGIFGFGGFLTAGIANAAHLSGLVLGLLYGLYLKDRGQRAPGELSFGGRGPGGPGRGRF